MKKVILITGASGLLGRAVFKVLKECSDYEVVGLAHSRKSNDLINVDLTNSQQVKETFVKYKVRSKVGVI